jgi:hypothetical protein
VLTRDEAIDRLNELFVVLATTNKVGGLIRFPTEHARQLPGRPHPAAGDHPHADRQARTRAPDRQGGGMSRAKRA